MKHAGGVNKRILTIFLGLIAVCLAGHAWADGDAWHVETPMPIPATAQVTAVIGETLFVSTYDFTYGVALLEAYDAESETWDMSRTPDPTPRTGAAGGVIDGKLYVAGGCGGGDCGNRLSVLHVYDPVLDTWTNLTPMDVPRHACAGAVIDGKLYVVGGIVGAYGYTTVGRLDVYDPVSNAWTTLASMTMPRYSLRAAAIDGKLYVVGGYVQSAGQATAALEVYDPDSDSWSTGASMPTDRYSHAVGVIDGRLYCVGGYSSSLTAEVGTLEEYDPVTDVWTARASMPTPRMWLGVGVIEGRLHAVGGGITGPVGTMEVYTPHTLTPAEAVEALLDDIDALGLPKGVAKGLKGPLKNLVSILEDGNPNNDGAACGKLGAFIHKVNARENSGKLTAAEADGLRQSAEAILDSLGCS